VAPLHPENAAWEILVEASLKQTRDATLGGGRVYREWKVDHRLGELRGIPTTILRGQGDAYLSSAALCERITASIPGATLRAIPNATHSPNVEAPDAWVAALMQHLNGVAR
jgi:pimeloyl-ACP methyl ester carboxylesterase